MFKLFEVQETIQMKRLNRVIKITSVNSTSLQSHILMTTINLTSKIKRVNILTDPNKRVLKKVPFFICADTVKPYELEEMLGVTAKI